MASGQARPARHSARDSAFVRDYNQQHRAPVLLMMDISWAGRFQGEP
jgi:hypothetical protein